MILHFDTRRQFMAHLLACEHLDNLAREGRIQSGPAIPNAIRKEIDAIHKAGFQPTMDESALAMNQLIVAGCFTYCHTQN